MALKDPSAINGALSTDVVVVGAGPAGLMLAANLVRFGIRTTVIDDRPDKTSTGRADGLQPKSIETLKQMRLADPLLQRGARVYDICFWSSTAQAPLRRTGREVHYPKVVDLLDPYILLVHQGMVEDLFIDDMRARGIEVTRSSSFVSYSQPDISGGLEVVTKDAHDNQHLLHTQYLVGCDGAHSEVRKAMSGKAEGSSSEAMWGVLDGVINTDFPDLWSKVVIYSEQAGNVLCIPRERGMTRLYIELRSENAAAVSKTETTQEFVMQRARQIISPYSLEWESVEWFGVYRIGQRVADRFADDAQRVFIAGDASHTHSPKAAQGMNTSMHDSLNLAWKLNLTIRGLAKPELLATYQHERRKIARDLIEFDHEHANSFHAGDAKLLAQNFRSNVRFISGVGAEYESNIINATFPETTGGAQPGCLLLPARLTRYIDANPVDAQIDIPMLGQFRIYFICHDIKSAIPFLDKVCSYISSSSSILGRATATMKASYEDSAPKPADSDAYLCPERYSAVSNLYTLAIVTSTSKAGFEIADLPPLLQASRWTIYLDDVGDQDTQGQNCIEKWIGPIAQDQVGVIIVRPDGYIGAVHHEQNTGGSAVAEWLDHYYEGFIRA